MCKNERSSTTYVVHFSYDSCQTWMGLLVADRGNSIVLLRLMLLVLFCFGSSQTTCTISIKNYGIKLRYKDIKFIICSFIKYFLVKIKILLIFYSILNLQFKIKSAKEVLVIRNKVKYHIKIFASYIRYLWCHVWWTFILE